MGEKSTDSYKLKQTQKKASKLGFDRAAFTLVMCVDRKTSKCCSSNEMEDAWKHLKSRCKRWRKERPDTVIRVKAGCLDICKGGPILGVLPDGIWYGNCTPDVIDRIFDEHLSGGNIVRQHVIAG
jgi:(2Fe-2S) ferredoxin